MSNWPTQAGVRAFYGEPGNAQCTAALVNLPYRMRIAWDLNSTIVQFRCHTKCEAAFERIFQKTLQHYGLPAIQKLRLDLFGGCYNLRKMRGGSSWSMHSWGIAIDLDPERNALKMTKKTATFARPEYVPFWNIVESEGGVSLGRQRDYDWMHFQFARL
jgi:hypothetical protein